MYGTCATDKLYCAVRANAAPGRLLADSPCLINTMRLCTGAEQLLDEDQCPFPPAGKAIFRGPQRDGSKLEDFARLMKCAAFLPIFSLRNKILDQFQTDKSED
jgi:hypothetical protein